jgi:hypothetical protein
MKKFLVTFVVLVILASLALFFGWAHREVPPDSYGLIRSKTHGLDTRLVIPGEFRWVWYKLIPTNTITLVFRLDPVNHYITAHDTLPSGAVYAAFAGIEGGFSWDLRASFSFCLRPEALAQLVTDYNIGTQDELNRYENDLAGQIEAFILRRIQAGNAFSPQIEELLANGETPELEQEIVEQFPLITGFSLLVQSAHFPDFSLYRQAKGLYEYYTAFQKDYITGELREKAGSRVESYRRLDELEQYGALLTKYPILLDYLALER